MIEEEAEIEGVSASEFVRNCAMAAILIRRASTNPALGINWERARREASNLLADGDD